MQSPTLVDPVVQFVPWLQLARRELLAGHLPLWNPYQDGGVPLLGNAISALATPLVWPALILGVEAGWNLGLLLRILLAVSGAFLWLRDLGRSRPSSALGAVAFGFSGPFVAWLEHPHTLAAAPVPLLLLFTRRLARAPTRGAFLGLAATTLLVLAGGHPETQLMAAFLAGAVVTFEVRSLRGLMPPVAAAALGAGLGAPLLLPFIEYLGLSDYRAVHTPITIPPVALIRFLLPNAEVGHPIEAAATVSLAVLVLAAAGLVICWRDREVTFWVVIAGICVLLAYSNPLARLLAERTPIHWSRVLLFMPLALGVLSSAGLDRLRSTLRIHLGQTWASMLAYVAVAIAAGELAMAGRGVHAITPAADVSQSTPLLDRLLADPEPFRVLPMGTFLTPNLATSYGIEDLRGYDAINPRGWRVRREEIGRFRLEMMSLEDLRRGGGGLNFWNVKYLLLPPRPRWRVDMIKTQLGLDLEEVYAGPDGLIWYNRQVLPRARLTGPGEAVLEDRSETAWRFRVTAPISTSLVVANPNFPGWSVRIDGKQVPLMAKPGDPMEVTVPAGRHRVDLVYTPLSFWAGVLIAVVSALILVAVLAATPWGGRPHRVLQPPGR